jgi:hypothetical protein
MRALVGAVVVAAGLALAGCSSEPSCAEQLKQDEATVRTTHHLDNDDLPAVGHYAEVHWQADAKGDPCTRGRGPTDWAYQDVIVLRDADATALKAAWNWPPVTGPTPSPAHQIFAVPSDIWPALAGYLPKSAPWTHSDAYDTAGFPGQSRSVYLDPDHATLLVFTFDY